MSEKILGICAALVALAALTIPASASAATTLTLRENGVKVPVEAKIAQMAFKLYTDTNTSAASAEDPLQIDDVD